MAEVVHTYRDESNERDLFVLALEKPEDFPEQLALGSPRFACLIAWDAKSADATSVNQLAGKLLRAGAVYVCTWGPDCHRVHNAIAQYQMDPPPTQPAGRIALTTAQPGEPIGEAIWHVLYCSMPDDAFAQDCGSTLGITIGSQAWAAEMRAAFTDPIAFSLRLTHPQ